MTSWRRLVWVGILALSFLPGVARAESEVDILLDKLVEKGVLSNVEAGLIRREIAETKETRNKELAKEIVPESARNWKWKGDIRLRNETRNREQPNATQPNLNTNRQRIRFRYGAEGKINDQLKAAFRVATGVNTDPVSTNQSFDQNFNKITMNLDLANLEYTPIVPGISKLSVIGGIMENPLWTVGPMVWDGDLTMHGAAVKLAQETGPWTLFSNNGVFSLDTDESESSSLWVTQAGASLKIFPDEEDELLKNLKLTGALAYHDYRNTYTTAANKSGTDPLTREGQNTALAVDFNQINPSLELASQIEEIPFSLFGDWVHNASGGRDRNDGFHLGFKVGKATVPWSLMKGWEAGYFYQRLAADAAYDEFTDSDFLDGGTNNRGHAVWLTVATLKNSTLGAKFIAAKQLEHRASTVANTTGSTGKDHENRLQVDWVTKF